MTVVGGLVGSEAQKLDTGKASPLGEWAIRNAWGVLLVGSILFWTVLAGILVFG